MTLAQLIPLTINVSVFLLVLALGLATTREDALYLPRHPRLLARSIFAMNVVMVFIAVAIVLVFDMPLPVRVALLALAISPVPPILPGKQQKAGGTESYAIGLLVAASIISVGLAPITLGLIGRVFDRPVGVPAERIAFVIAVSIVAPLVIGILVRRFAPGLAIRIKRPLSLLATGLLVLACLPALYTAWPAVWGLVGNGVAVVLVAFTVIGLCVGHLLGGPVPRDRAVLALATGTRHPGVAIAIVTINFPSEKAALAVVLYHVVVGALVSIPYVQWRRRVAAARPDRAEESSSHGP